MFESRNRYPEIHPSLRTNGVMVERVAANYMISILSGSVNPADDELFRETRGSRQVMTIKSDSGTEVASVTNVRGIWDPRLYTSKIIYDGVPQEIPSDAALRMMDTDTFIRTLDVLLTESARQI